MRPWRHEAVGDLSGQTSAQVVLDEIAVVVSEQKDLEALRRRLIQQAKSAHSCSLSEIAEAAGLTRQGVRYLLAADTRKAPANAE